MSKLRVYFAAPLFTSAERQWNKCVQNIIEHLDPDIQVWLPQDNEPICKNAASIFCEDVSGIDCSDVVVAIMDGPDPDSGTSWECGYAYAKSKPLILIRTDFRGGGEDREAPYNIMLAQCATLRAEMPSAFVSEVAERIVRLLREVER